MSVAYDTVIFDLDGTLLETQRGVVGSFRHAMSQLGLDFPQGFDERRLLGPPLLWSFVHFLGVPQERAADAVAAHRAFYGGGALYDAEPYPGMISLLDELQAAGTVLCLATSKFEGMALRVLDHFDLRKYFQSLAMSKGTELTSSKAGLIEDVLRQSNTPPERAVMIGDTTYDAEGAAACKVPFIGVLHGFGTQQDMEQAGPAVFARDAAELRSLLFT